MQLFITFGKPAPYTMYQKDYILRLIEQAAKFIAEVLRLIKKGEHSEASERLDSIYYDILKEDAAYFRNIPENELTGKLLEHHNYTNGHLEILAGLFNAEAELNMAMGKNPECLEYSRKALLLFEFVDKENRTYSTERLKTIEDIRYRIKRLS